MFKMNSSSTKIPYKKITDKTRGDGNQQSRGEGSGSEIKIKIKECQGCGENSSATLLRNHNRIVQRRKGGDMSQKWRARGRDKDRENRRIRAQALCSRKKTNGPSICPGVAWRPGKKSVPTNHVKKFRLAD